MADPYGMAGPAIRCFRWGRVVSDEKEHTWQRYPPTHNPLSPHAASPPLSLCHSRPTMPCPPPPRPSLGGCIVREYTWPGCLLPLCTPLTSLPAPSNHPPNATTLPPAREGRGLEEEEGGAQPYPAFRRIYYSERGANPNSVVIANVKLQKPRLGDPIKTVQPTDSFVRLLHASPTVPPSPCGPTRAWKQPVVVALPAGAAHAARHQGRREGMVTCV